MGRRASSIPTRSRMRPCRVLRRMLRPGALQGCIAGKGPSDLFAIETDLTRFDAPTLIVWVTDDVFFPVEWAG